MSHSANTSVVNSSAQHSEDDELNVVAAWLSWDTRRVVAGAAAGAFAGLVALLLAMVLSAVNGLDLWFPAKFAALPVLGGTALRYDNTMAIGVGLIVHQTLSMVLGMFYSHFTINNVTSRLFGAGLVWGIFSWIFISCLFVQSFPDIAAVNLPKSAYLLVNMVFGLSLMSVSMFDRAVRGGEKAGQSA